MARSSDGIFLYGLSNCPFCGGPYQYFPKDEDGIRGYVSCDACQADGPFISRQSDWTEAEWKTAIMDAWDARGDESLGQEEDEYEEG